MVDTLNDLSILVVDDEPMIIEIMEEEFALMNFRVLSAGSAVAALDIAKQHKPDAVITDMRMPNHGGDYLVSKLREEFGTNMATFINSGEMQLTVAEVLSIGANGVFHKPCDMELVATAVRTTCKKVNQEFAGDIRNTTVLRTRYTRHFKSVAEASGQRAIIFGFGGFFMAFDAVDFVPRVGDGVGFHFDFEDVQMPRLKGIGQIRWVRNHPDTHGGRGIGVEFLWIEEADRDALNAFLASSSERIVAFIPKG